MSYSRETKISKVSAAQSDILCNFFEENPEVIRGYKKTAKSIDEIQNKWKNVTKLLNVVGPPRDYKSWAKYICNMKAKLKKKRIKWRQSTNGKCPIMCNPDDFDDIKLRMLQVLRKCPSNSQESQDSEYLNTEDDSNYCDAHNEDEMDTVSQNISDESRSVDSLAYSQSAINNTPPLDLQQRHIICNDEFDYFGKNVAQQLRTLPLCVALETQEIILSILKKQRQKVLYEISSSSDPLSDQ